MLTKVKTAVVDWVVDCFNEGRASTWREWVVSTGLVFSVLTVISEFAFCIPAIAQERVLRDDREILAEIVRIAIFMAVMGAAGAGLVAFGQKYRRMLERPRKARSNRTVG